MLNEVGKSKVDKHWGQTFWELWEAGDIRIMSAIAIRRKMAQSQREIKLGYNDDGTSNAQRKLLDDREQSASAKLNSNPAFNDGDDFENLEMIVGLEDTKFESKNKIQNNIQSMGLGPNDKFAGGEDLGIQSTMARMAKTMELMNTFQLSLAKKISRVLKEVR